MIGTRKRLEHDWFIPKDIWRIFDSEGLVISSTYNDRFIYWLTGATVKHYNE